MIPSQLLTAALAGDEAARRELGRLLDDVQNALQPRRDQTVHGKRGEFDLQNSGWILTPYTLITVATVWDFIVPRPLTVTEWAVFGVYNDAAGGANYWTINLKTLINTRTLATFNSQNFGVVSRREIVRQFSAPFIQPDTNRVLEFQVTNTGAPNPVTIGAAIYCV